VVRVIFLLDDRAAWYTGVRMSTHQGDSDSESEGSSEAEDSHMGEHIGEFEDLDVLSRAFLNAVGAGAAPRRAAPPSPPATYVVDRRGAHVAVQFDKITARNEALRTNPKYGPVLAAIDSSAITAEIVRRFRNGMTTRELDVETAATCADRASHHSDYEWLAARVHVNDLHKRTPRGLGEMVRALAAAAADARCVRLSPEYAAIVERASAAIDARLEFSRDYRLRHFGFQTMARGYLLRPGARSEESSLLDTQLMERPQHLYMRIALGIFVCRADKRGHEAPEEAFGRRLAAAFQLYDALSLQLVSHATPTILNAGTKVTQLSSCFQTATGDDLHQLLLTHLHIGDISKWSGGVSLWLHNVRAEGALIRGTGGRSTGLKHYVRMLNDLQMYVDQGGNRPGAFAIYLSVDHDDIFTLLAQGRLKGEETLKEVAAPDLKLALWVSDLYMEALAAQLRNAAAVEAGEPDDPEAGDWYLFCPDEAPGLHLTWGDAYRELYERYVAEGRYRRRVKAGDIMEAAFKNWAQGGTPYVVNKCPVNRKSNMQNVAPICSSNLCEEITIPSWSEFDAPEFAQFHPDNAAGGEYGVCNLAAVALESFIRVDSSPSEVTFDFAGEAAAAGLECRALNAVIDLNYNPSEECRRSNHRHRPIGIGLIGFADALARKREAYGTREAARFARGIAATLYFGAMQASAALAETDGPYETFEGSPVSRGLLQPDLWVADGSLAPGWEAEVEDATGGFIKPADWAALRARCRRGVRNAYVTAYMPTATTSNIVGQNECFEPFTSNLYVRKTLAGEFTIVNRHLMAELVAAGLWDDRMRREVIAAGGSIQGIERIPADVRRRYRTAREIHPSLFIRMVKAMAPFVCQSMSLNLYLNEPDLPKILRFLIEGWREGIKSLAYYVHTKSAAGSQKTSVRTLTHEGAPAVPVAEETPQQVCSRTNREACTSCAL
jgi:ribonucleoside-diphosphate reductase alpha subunit